MSPWTGFCVREKEREREREREKKRKKEREMDTGTRSNITNKIQHLRRTTYRSIQWIAMSQSIGLYRVVRLCIASFGWNGINNYVHIVPHLQVPVLVQAQHPKNPNTRQHYRPRQVRLHIHLTQIQSSHGSGRNRKHIYERSLRLKRKTRNLRRTFRWVHNSLLINNGNLRSYDCNITCTTLTLMRCK